LAAISVVLPDIKNSIRFPIATTTRKGGRHLPIEKREPMKKIITIVAILTMAFIAGCSDSPSGKEKSQGKLIDPCNLITKADAQQFVGEPFKDAEKRENKVVGQKFCIYNSAKEGSFRLFQISLTEQALMPNSGQSPKSIYDALKANFPKAVKVNGIGDDAFIATPGLHILKGNYYITIAVGNSENPNNRRILDAAGKKAVENLEKLTGK
jgi:hypothetical protein